MSRVYRITRGLNLPSTVEEIQKYLNDLSVRADMISFGDTASVDAFARARVSNPYTLFDSKQVFDNQPLFWDDAETSGTGTSSTHSTNEAATTISVGAGAGTRVRQTFRRFNYQPGKSQLVIFTFSEFDTATGITKRAGYFDDDNGLFYESDEGTLKVVRRSSVTGSAVDTAVSQSAWNIDKLDGTGVSGITLDLTKTQIGFLDFEWLGVGRVRMGFFIDGRPFYCHELLNTNSLSTVYMSTPNLPVRYEIANDGNGSADDFVHICSTVISEGGSQDIGSLRCASTDGTHVDANSANTIYALVGLRLKSTHLGSTVKNIRQTVLSETNDDFEWLFILNPTVAGTFTYSDETNSCLQSAKGATANTVTGGTRLDGGFAKQSQASSEILNNAITLGAAIDGTRDEMVLCVRPLSSNADIQGSLTWRELS